MDKDILSEITAIMVLYDTDEIVFKCLENLKDVNLIIADNGKNNLKIINKIKGYKNVIKFFKFKKNIGYGRANNFCQKYVKTKFTLLIEPDVIISQNDIIKLTKGFNTYPNAGILMPTIINNEGEIVDKLTNLPELLNKNHFINNKENLAFHGDTCINFDLSAIMLFKNSTLNKYGLFNKSFFIYWEDCYLCRHYKKNNLPIVKIFDSRALHQPGTSMGWNFLTKFIGMKHYMKSSLIYFHTPKNIFFLKKRIILYFLRTIAYLLILNINKASKNFAKFCGMTEYVFKFNLKKFLKKN